MMQHLEPVLIFELVDFDRYTRSINTTENYSNNHKTFKSSQEKLSERR